MFVIRFVLKLLGILVRVRAHTRLHGAVKVIEYWRHA